MLVPKQGGWKHITTWKTDALKVNINMNKVNGCRMDKGARIPPKAFPCGRLDLCSRNQIGSSSCKIFDKNYNTFYNL